jgi:hypothetical protein
MPHAHTQTTIQVGDEVLEINGFEITSIHQIRDLSVGPVGSKCVVTARRGQMDAYEVELERRADPSSPSRYLCMYVCMHACMHACMHVSVYSHT